MASWTSFAAQQNPMVDLKPLWGPIYPASLAMTFAQTLAIKGLVIAASDTNVPDNPAQIARFFARELPFPFVKAVSTGLLTRAIQHKAIEVVPSDWAGHLVRDPVREASRLHAERLESGKSRLEISSNVFHSAFLGAVIPNASIYLVEQTLLIHYHIQLRRRIAAATSSMNAAPKGSKEYQEAHIARVRAVAELTNSAPVLEASSLLLLRSAGTVATEAAGSALGTFIFPGIGTMIGQLIGQLVCWLL